MKKLSPRFVSLAAVLCVSLFFSCTSDVEILPPPPQTGNTSSGSEQVWSYCVYPEVQLCYQGSYSTCPGGGILSNNCLFTDEPSSSSPGGNATASSSSISEQSSSGAAPEYAYCVFATDRMCLTGPINACPPGGMLNNDCPYSSSSSSLSGNLSSGVQQAYSSSTTPNTTPSSSSVGTTYYCDFGLRETCPSCANGVGGGCFEMENQYGECDSRYGRVTTSCSTGLVCDWGYRYYDSSKSDCGNDYCGGCYVIGSGSGITVASCERDKGTVRSECPQSSLVTGTKPSSSSKPAGVSSSSVRPSSSSFRPSSSSFRPSSSSSLPGCVDEATCCLGTSITINATSSGTNAQTKNAICFKIQGSISSWNVYSANGRTCSANGGSKVTCPIMGNIQGQPAVSAINGFVYINCSAGDNDFTSVDFTK